MKAMWFILLIVVVAVVAAVVTASSENDVKNWATSNGYQVAEIEQRFINIGPFHYVMKGQVVWRTVLLDKSGQRIVMYHRGGMFGWEHERHSD